MIILLLTLLLQHNLLVPNVLYLSFSLDPSSNSTFFPKYDHYSTPISLFLNVFPLSLYSCNPNPQSSFPTPQKPSLYLTPSSSNPPSTFYDPYASLHPGFHNYPLSNFQSSALPPNQHPLHSNIHFYLSFLSIFFLTSSICFPNDFFCSFCCSLSLFPSIVLMA